MTDFLATALILFGAFFVLVGSIGLARFPDFFTRLHAPTKASTLGLAGLQVAFIVYALGNGDGLQLRELLISFFLFITAPVSAMILARSGLRRRVRSVIPTPAPVGEEDESPSRDERE